MNKHRIHRVAKLTGLSKDVIRVWERRYGLVTPSRSSNRYREYSDEDVALLRFVKAQMELGETIGGLATEGRNSLVARMRLATPLTTEDQKPHDNLLDDLVGLLDPMDKAGFERKLNGAVAVIPFEEAIQRILLPLQRRIGDLWHEGRLSTGVEHYVTKLIQQKLFSVMNQLPVNEFGPRVLIACPEGETHEIGAQAVAYTAATRGCQVYYLGPNLPHADLVAFCEKISPDLVLLSLTEAKSEAAMFQQLKDLEPLATRWPVAVGGQGARAFGDLLRDTKIELLEDLTALHSRLMILLSMRHRVYQ
ncbi:MAG: cobalamin B12-binding domain-containing protein [Nitrospira sp.]|nr:cobalamin B12-binding domain-containing protein [Nitrospira sp.]MDH4371374.1 cobalamin B12-binding domain-containing protein [Nitrospira sp.]MDH5498963.1 cobalamin B12-binding domain-containing protein [Nitrospira sp.]MDH5724839.1 cobalamin B12-binding domain-containing protein [Nitrospira sp.]